MTSLPMLLPSALAQQAQDQVYQGNYEQAISLYEQLVEIAPAQKQYSWWLGLCYLLSGHETEAQMTWTMALTDALDEAEAEEWTAELLQVLNHEAERLSALEKYQFASVIRQHIYEINPFDVDNVLLSLIVSVEREDFSIEQWLEELATFEIVELLSGAVEQASTQAVEVEITPELLLQVMQIALDRGHEYQVVLDFVQASATYLSHLSDAEAAIQLILETATHIGYVQRNHKLACQYGEICLGLAPHHPRTIALMSYFYIFVMRYEEAIRLAKILYETAQTVAEKAFASSAVLRSLTRAGGHWDDALLWLKRSEALLSNWLDACETDASLSVDINLLSYTAFYLPYFSDRPTQTRPLLNRIAKLSQQSLEKQLQKMYGAEHREQLFPSHSVKRSVNRSNRPLKIAYMSCFLRRHSIGWLARWLMHHHDRDRFDVQVYFMQQSEVSPFGQKWYADKASRAACFHGDPLVMAQAIHENEIDILIDLDSLTTDATMNVLALKPAPIQVTWLGWDASGLPSVDYYIADRYVLPEDAQDYYSEKIWRLPTTYLAVDGFEVGVPSIRRDSLDIPADAVVYFSSQTGQKRNPDNIRTQLKILRQVPNSYFLVKGMGDSSSVKAMFEQLAAEEGVSFDRLRFLPPTTDEETHRANLAIADVVLDTFPYNGATTTMETLWMGIPLVTKVGEQFAARNSYGMMKNAGIEEGIAWSDEEYVEWGVRLGKDAALRQEISQRLKQARQTAPLFNAKQFTRDMEAAFEQMWQIYLEQH